MATGRRPVGAWGWGATRIKNSASALNRPTPTSRAFEALAVAIALAVGLVFVLLLMALGSVAEVSVILLTLPDAFVGGILALILTGETLNVSSAVGFIGLFGIAVQNGLVLIAQRGRCCWRA